MYIVQEGSGAVRELFKTIGIFLPFFACKEAVGQQASGRIAMSIVQ
jgi:hypothetical protein